MKPARGPVQIKTDRIILYIIQKGRKKSNINIIFVTSQKSSAVALKMRRSNN